MSGARLWLLVAFLLSGFSALIYQLVWQRSLFAIYGIDTASVTVVVTAFMAGLGVGSLLGGDLSKRLPALPLFAAFELGIGAYGLVSLPLFAWAGSFTLDLSRLGTGLVTFALVLLPTTLMGATLPLLVAHAARRSGNVGRSVGTLYFVNTLGAAVACFVTAWALLKFCGMAGSVRIAAAINILLGIGVFALRGREETRA